MTDSSEMGPATVSNSQPLTAEIFDHPTADTPGAQTVDDPPPPYPAHQRQGRRNRRPRAQQVSSTSSDNEPVTPISSARALDDELSETTPLLAPGPSSPVVSSRRPTFPNGTRPRSASIISGASVAPSLAQTVLSLFRHDLDSGEENETDEDHLTFPRTSAAQHDVHEFDALEMAQAERRRRWNMFNGRAWRRYFRAMKQRSCWAAAFHLLVLNFPFALVAWLYLLVFTAVSVIECSLFCGFKLTFVCIDRHSASYNLTAWRSPQLS